MPRYIRLPLCWCAVFVCGCSTTEHAANRIDKVFDDDEIAACRDLVLLPGLTITYADVVEKFQGVPAHCYVKGVISGSISWHAQLPARVNWSGRFVHKGDGGTDGDLDFKAGLYKDSWLRTGDAVANSNTGHDIGTGPNWALHDRQAEIDFGYRAVHLTTVAAKTLVEAYYGRPPDYSYHVGCSNGGRQGLVAAQRFPEDFDGIVAGAPSIFRARNFYHHLKLMQHLYRDNMAANLAYDSNGDGSPDSLDNVGDLYRAVLDRCDAIDGVADGVIDYPPACDFDLERYLSDHACADDAQKGRCFTAAQAAYVRHLRAGSEDASGRPVYPGVPEGSEYVWDQFVAADINSMTPYVLESIMKRFQSVFDVDPGVAPADITDVTRTVHDGALPEWAWWQYDVEDLFEDTAEMTEIYDATETDLRRFFEENNGKLLLYQGWDDPYHAADLLIDYYERIVASSFGGDRSAASGNVRLFMMPGVQHCNYGPGPDRWERLQTISDWVEQDRPPDRIVSWRQPFDVRVNERPLCPYPERPVYVGAEGGQDDAANWVAANFECRLPD